LISVSGWEIEKMSDYLNSQCQMCSHFHGGDGNGNAVCDAFPNGIPIRILIFHFDHSEEFPGDNGIRFEIEDRYRDFDIKEWVSKKQKEAVEDNKIDQCYYCSHMHENQGNRNRGIKVTCDAFPEGIPDSIQMNRFNHINPHPGDKGIRFNPLVPADDERQKRIIHLNVMKNDSSQRNNKR
jgi:hypothetical protein